jgi:cytochrome c-type protein NapB
METIIVKNEADARQTVPGWRRVVSLLSVGFLGLVLVGFLRGIADPPPPTRAKPSLPDAAADDVPKAVEYGKMAAQSLGPNRDWQSELSRLQFPRPGLFDPVTRTEQARLAALADRASNRAFDGAPPTVPHPIDQTSATSCLACHGEGLRLGDKLATKMSHPFFTNCTQCHVESRTTAVAEQSLVVENHFVGRRRSGPGQRALIGSPPTIPHTTWLRQDCMSCHGLIARAGIRTTHPWLTNCTQCHAPNASLDQQPLAKFPAN